MKQQNHYDKVYHEYVVNMDYPHTKTYNDYINNELIRVLKTKSVGVTTEICCGHGEVLSFISNVTQYIGVDISYKML